MPGCLLLTMLHAGAVTAELPETVVLHSFDAPDSAAGLVLHDVAVERVEHGGGGALRVDFAQVDWPNVWFPGPEGGWDWSAHAGLAVDVTNPGETAVEVAIRVDNEGADGAVNCNQQSWTVPPGETSTCALTFTVATARFDYPLWGMRGTPASGPRTLDPTKVVAFQVFLPRPAAPRRLILDNVRLFGHGAQPVTATSRWFVDRFGQYAWADWPGKLHDEADWPVRLAAEEADLAARPVLPGRDEYGGWADGPQLEATGWFRVEQVDGRWWLVTPSGHLFFSAGMDCVRVTNQTIISARDGWFEWLPERGGEHDEQFGRFNGLHQAIRNPPVTQGDTFNFTGANLRRKYGPEWRDRARDMAHRRLVSWGFNTIANWSEESMKEGSPVPFVATAHIGGNHARVSDGVDYWGQMHDPFDPRFAEDARAAVRGQAERYADEPMCLGIFVDNELAWGGEMSLGLAAGSLNAPAEQPARQAAVEFLRERYATVAELSAAWGSEYADWDAVRAPVLEVNATCRADLQEFVYRFARRYFETVRDAVRELMPNHLYLGCRFAWSNRQAIRAASEICDVVSFNIYQPRVDRARWGFANELGRPVIIGEFHFGALDRGMFHTGLVRAADQDERARMYLDYLRSVADLPAFVGCHWFQYLDQPITGRVQDGENYNIGFVTIVDEPAAEMVAAARQVHAELYARHAAAE